MLILNISVFYPVLWIFLLSNMKIQFFPNKIKVCLNRIWFWLCGPQVSKCSGAPTSRYLHSNQKLLVNLIGRSLWCCKLSIHDNNPASTPLSCHHVTLCSVSRVRATCQSEHPPPVHQSLCVSCDSCSWSGDACDVCDDSCLGDDGGDDSSHAGDVL